MSWDWEQERDKVAVNLRGDIGFPIGPLELADQMHLDASTSMVVERISRVVYGRGTGAFIGFLGAADVESDQRRDTDTEA